MSNDGSCVSQGGRHARVSQVCSSCRSRHLKCDGGPLCSRCHREGIACVFKPSRRGMRPSYRRESAPDHKDSGYTILEWSPPNSFHRSSPPFTAPIPPARSRSQSLSMVKIQAPPTSPQSAHLIDLFYSLFFPTHPFTLPRDQLAEKLETRDLHYLQVVIEYIGSYYDARSNRARYRYLSELLLFTQEYAEDIFKVQAFILLAIGLHADGEPNKADNALRQAHDIASLCGMNDVACSAPLFSGMSLDEESARRTWWTLKSLCHSWPPPRPLSAVSTPFSVARSNIFETSLPSATSQGSPSLPPIIQPIPSRKVSPFPYLTGEEFWNFPIAMDPAEDKIPDLNLDFITDESIRRLYAIDSQLCDPGLSGSR